MFRWLRERRQRKQKEAAERRAQLRRKAQLSGINLTSAQLRIYRQPEPVPFYMTLAPDQPDELAAIIAMEDAPFSAHRTLTTSTDYAPVKSEQELPRSIQISGGGGSGGTGGDNIGGSGGSGRHAVVQHHYGSGDNIGGSVHHASHHDSHSSHDYGSSSYDSGSGSGGSDSSW